MFYTHTKTSPLLRGSSYTAAEKGDAGGARVGAFVAETVALPIRVVVGSDLPRGNTASLAPSAGAWGVINGGVGKICRGIGWLGGLAGGVLTSPVGLALGIGFKKWVVYAASSIGIAVGALLAKLPVEASETLRCVCIGLLNALVSGVSKLSSNVGGAVGTLIDLAIGPAATVERLSFEW